MRQHTVGSKSSIIVILLMVAASIGTAFAPNPGRAEWSEIEPGGETGCGPGSDYRFFVHPGNREMAVLFLQGGGGCWSSQTCSLDGPPTYDVDAVSSDLTDDAEGLLDLENPENPIGEATVVFVPYCTGDAHLGRRTQRYPLRTADGSIEFVQTHHNGNANVLAAIDWLTRAVPSPEIAFITGESAGGAAAAFYAGVLADRYPEAKIVHLADSSSALRARAMPDIMATWGATEVIHARPGYADYDDLYFETLYTVEALRHPRISWAQLNRVDDAIQAFFIGIAGRNHETTREVLAEARDEVKKSIPGLVSFDAEGFGHTILTSPAFYSESAGGVRIRDWVAALLTDEPPSNVRCRSCGLIPSKPGSSPSNR